MDNKSDFFKEEIRYDSRPADLLQAFSYFSASELLTQMLIKS